MRFIVSPAKKMRVVDDSLPVRSAPAFLDRAQRLAEAVRQLDYSQAQALWRCSDSLAELNFERFLHMDLQTNALTPALLAYEGIQYQHLAPHVMQDDQLDYLQKHLRILSGFYGVLRPFDCVVPYRLEMQAKLACEGHQNLYAFWGSSLYEELAEETDLIVNLASVEYAKAVLPYAQAAAKRDQERLQGNHFSQKNNSKLSVVPRQARSTSAPSDDLHTSCSRIVTCHFGTLNKEGRLIQRSTAAKAARGSMVRWCAENKVFAPCELKEFDVAGYCYNSLRSTPETFVFVQQ